MILFLTGNVMAQSVHERIPEFAVMKTLGMTDGLIFTLVLVEALLPYLLGAVLGLALSQGVAMLVSGAQNIGVFAPVITPGVIMFTLIVAVLAAVLGGLPSAWRVRQLPIAEALVVR
jgi:putative ABC transport system permease protein